MDYQFWDYESTNQQYRDYLLVAATEPWCLAQCIPCFLIGVNNRQWNRLCGS